MPSIRNEGTNPVMIDDIAIPKGQTVHVPDAVWNEWIKNPIAKSLAKTMLVVAGKGKKEQSQEEDNTSDDETYNAAAQAIREMLDEDPDREGEMWMRDGRPDVKELNTRAKLKLKAAQRDEIWERYQNDNPDSNDE